MTAARILALISALMNVGVGLLYLGPDSYVRRPMQPGQISAVIYIESFGPIWVLGFAGTGLLLLTTYIRHRGFVRAHILAAVTWAGYAGAILFSAALTEPPAPVLTGFIAGFVAVLQIGFAVIDSKGGHR